MLKNLKLFTTGLTLLALVLFITSCKKARTIYLLEGDWEASSFTVDGEELINVEYSSLKIEFEEYGKTEGDFNLTFVDVNGSTIPFSGEYELNDDVSELDLTFNTTNEKVTFDFEVDKDDLKLEGNVGGYFWIIRADRD
ncbi:MAG: hypothetical protein KDC44_19800 [Phaeodactylibacter sp.]|nr:hypothetical protein [Phaeodactylibacter sp.]